MTKPKYTCTASIITSEIPEVYELRLSAPPRTWIERIYVTTSIYYFHTKTTTRYRYDEWAMLAKNTLWVSAVCQPSYLLRRASILKLTNKLKKRKSEAKH